MLSSTGVQYPIMCFGNLVLNIFPTSYFVIYLTSYLSLISHTILPSQSLGTSLQRHELWVEYFTEFLRLYSVYKCVRPTHNVYVMFLATSRPVEFGTEQVLWAHVEYLLQDLIISYDFTQYFSVLPFWFAKYTLRFEPRHSYGKPLVSQLCTVERRAVC